MEALFGRRMSRLTAAALLVFASALTSTAAIALDQTVSIDPATGAISVGGWARRVADTGTIFYTCEDDFCGRGSIVSMRRQPQPAAPDADAMRRSEGRVADAIRERSKGQIARIDIGEPAVSRNGRFSVGEVARDVVAAPGAALDLHLHWKSGYVTSPELMVSLSASSNTRRNCDDNYATFKRGLMQAITPK